MIVYRVINTDRVMVTATEKPSVGNVAASKSNIRDNEYLRFKVVLDYIDSNDNQQLDEPEERLIGLRLQPLSHFILSPSLGRIF